jgi:nucleoside 2-deoxyribosyltransferase
MTAKGYLRTEIKFKASGYQNPVSTNHAIYERDKWMVEQCDIVLMDLTYAKFASIGCTMELAWASLLNKHTIIVMGEDNVHRHAFILEAADIIFATMDDAIGYLRLLRSGKMETERSDYHEDGQG